MNWKIYRKRRLGRELASLTSEEQEFLFSEFCNEEELVLEELLKSNINLIHKLCHKSLGRGIEYSDLFSSGMIGLVWAARKFDIEKNIKFSTYAYYWIQQKINRCLEQEKDVIRLPAHVMNTIRKIDGIEGMSLLDLAELTGKSLGNIKNALVASEISVSSTSDDEGSVLEVEDNYDLSKSVEYGVMSDLLWDVVGKLEPRQKEVIVGFFLDEEGIDVICERMCINKREFEKIMRVSLFELRKNPLLVEWFNGKI